MKEHTISRLAIFILSAVMIVFGISHFQNPKDLVVFVPAFLPGGIIWVYIVGVSFILAAIAFILNRYVKLAAYLLAFLLFLFVIAIHFPNYNNAGDTEMRQMAFNNLLKDLAIAAFAMHIGSNAQTVG